MKLSRDIALKIHWVFDQLIPPILRDCKWFMWLPIKLAFRHKAHLFMRFKDEAYRLTDEEYAFYYNETSQVSFERPTDLNHKSIELIMKNLSGTRILEVGCGKGYLANLMANQPQLNITAVDIVLEPHLHSERDNLHFQQCNIESLPFADQAFDTVVCTHTLEHVLHLQEAIRELRRVAKRKIIIVPKQRPYKYTFDLHINFFPYINSLLLVMGREGKHVVCDDADGDIFYMED